MTSDRLRRLKWLDDVILPMGEFASMTRRIDDLPIDVSKGALEIARLTAWRNAQRRALQRIMGDLTRLHAAPPEQWRREFLVADDGKPWDWQTAPWRRYASFEDFYRQELEETYGAWDELLRNWQDVVAAAAKARSR